MSSPRRLYFDTSAYLCVLLAEAGADRLSAESDGAELLSSALLVIETKRNLIRLVREGTLTPEAYATCVARMEDDMSRFVLRDLTLELCTSVIVPAVLTPRSLDLVHLRTALWFHSTDRIDRFITMDEPQRSAARELGLPV